MELNYDPGDGDRFWESIRTIPGYPTEDEIPLKLMIFGTDALLKLPEVLEHSGADRSQKLMVVMDTTPMRRGEDSLKPLILQILRNAGWHPDALVLEPDKSGQVHTDTHQIGAVKANIQEGSAVLSVGSGVVTDISKHACHLFEQEHGYHIPYIVFQTANSVCAYTSRTASVFVNGIKRTQDSRYPEALICDLETLCDAPREMTVAGIGDLLAVFVSFPDWYLAYCLGMDPSYTELPQTLLGPLDEIFLEMAADIHDPTPKGMAMLAKLVSLGGLAMSLSHATTPLSGYEHVMSHILDMINERSGQALPIHGDQVALTSVLGTRAYQKFLDEFMPEQVNIEETCPSKDQMRTHIFKVFQMVDPSGIVGTECWMEYLNKFEKWQLSRGALMDFLNEWGEILPKLQGLTRPSSTLLSILRAIGAPVHFSELKPPITLENAKFAFFNAPLMRKRLTLGDMFIFLDWDREKLWRQIQTSTGIV